MSRGGTREGAGRPKGQGRYGEPTRPVRVPESLVPEVLSFVTTRGIRLPLYACAVQAGFPSPADDHMEGRLDLLAHLVTRPEATFLVRAQGDSMTGSGIHSGDILVVDRSVEAKEGRVVIAVLDGLLTVKRLRRRDGQTVLESDNPDFAPIPVPAESCLDIWGVVTSVIHKV